ncbi:MAG: hypothetical protein EAZ15_04155 [Sphingobacteriales bacterium]|nr:MAG: hypothetical protein EAZ15_04155 [Sphingobacteriales bacterium]
MNFLSHYYFDRNNANSYQVLGAFLPDLVKNANKHWNIYPEKQNHNLFSHHNHTHLLKGWKKHLLVDKLFHSSDFFLHHQHQLKLELLETLKTTAIKPFFLAHISLELLLDSLLLTNQLINVEQLYQQLNQVNDHDLISFLEINKLEDIPKFLKFYASFKNEKYLLAYADADKISYSLKRICMRVWDKPLSPQQETELTYILLQYKLKLSQDFIFIFAHIAKSLNND